MVDVVVVGYSSNKPVLRNTCQINDDIYVTGNIGDAFLGLSVLTKKKRFWSTNSFMKFIYLISRVFLAWTFLNFLAYTVLF